MTSARLSHLLGALALAGLCALPQLGLAAVPLNVPVQAALTTAAGGPAPDGVYQVTFTLLDGAAGKVVWTEGPTALTAKSGVLGWSLGSKTPLSQAILSGERWLQLQVGPDPALPPVQLQSTPFAVRAGVAEDLECSGCVKAVHLDPAVLATYAKTADLAQYAKTADTLGFAKSADLGDYVKAASLAKVAGSGSYVDLLDKPKYADVATTGSYQDLSGTPVIPQVGKACGSGLFMRGIKADGSYDCAAGLDVALLPKDGLDEISNGLLTNQFLEVAASAKMPLDIPDGLAAGTADAIDVPDFGLAQAISVSIDLANSDISKVRVTLYDPSGAPYKLYDQNGTGKALKATYPNPDKPVAGDLSGWAGKNPKGTWSINVADLKSDGTKFDGKLNSWSIGVATLSSKKVAATGALLLANLSKEPFPCTAAVFGAQYASSTDKAVYICNGTSWFPLLLTALGTKEAPAINCKDLLTKAPITKSGVYWVDPDGSGQGDAAYQVYCDMTTDGGGWTLVWSNYRDGKGKPLTSMTWNTAINTTPLYFKGPVSDNLESFGAFIGLKRWAQLGNSELRYSWSADYGQPLQQSYKMAYSLNANANYTLSVSAGVQLVGNVAPGLYTAHNGAAFSTFDADHDSYGGNCAGLYSNTPFWYTACWSGNINGGGENNGDGHYNGAYWTGSQQSWAGAGGVGAGNGWVFVR